MLVEHDIFFHGMSSPGHRIIWLGGEKIPGHQSQSDTVAGETGVRRAAWNMSWREAAAECDTTTYSLRHSFTTWLFML